MELSDTVTDALEFAFRTFAADASAKNPDTAAPDTTATVTRALDALNARDVYLLHQYMKRTLEHLDGGSTFVARRGALSCIMGDVWCVVCGVSLDVDWCCVQGGEAGVGGDQTQPRECGTVRRPPVHRPTPRGRRLTLQRLQRPLPQRQHPRPRPRRQQLQQQHRRHRADLQRFLEADGAAWRTPPPPSRPWRPRRRQAWSLATLASAAVLQLEAVQLQLQWGVCSLTHQVRQVKLPLRGTAETAAAAAAAAPAGAAGDGKRAAARGSCCSTAGERPFNMPSNPGGVNHNKTCFPLRKRETPPFHDEVTG